MSTSTPEMLLKVEGLIYKGLLKDLPFDKSSTTDAAVDSHAMPDLGIRGVQEVPRRTIH
ncbi:hypothetical protein KKG63_00740 [Patescibacteria group bacterium]|nr:hypothetical protein [Patescibacteria group bacterium]